MTKFKAVGNLEQHRGGQETDGSMPTKIVDACCDHYQQRTRHDKSDDFHATTIPQFSIGVKAQ